ncbi:Zinc finger CCCH domain-containing protein 7 [Ananas comosus]|uniref:Zinc finger CCCH domain-containing protein 7 n=1 Tax=Ananas comosus TaxID=4615 RepID=A0A199USD6_ANACO|nr:Zinc finger CCCH domain-containing protein 7 [Ananas comosus]
MAPVDDPTSTAPPTAPSSASSPIASTSLSIPLEILLKMQTLARMLLLLFAKRRRSRWLVKSRPSIEMRVARVVESSLRSVRALSWIELPMNHGFGEDSLSGDGLMCKDEVLQSVEECLQREDANMVEGLENGECVDNALLNDLISDFSGLIDARDDVVCSVNGLESGEKRDGNFVVACGETQKNVNDQVSSLVDQLKQQKDCTQNDQCDLGFSLKAQEVKHGESDASKHELPSFAKPNQIISSSESQHCSEEEERIKCLNGETHNETPEEIMQKEANSCLELVMDVSKLENFNQTQADQAVSLVDDEEIEEGEIPDDAQELDEDLYEVHEDEILSDRDSEEDAGEINGEEGELAVSFDDRSNEGRPLLGNDRFFMLRSKGDETSVLKAHASCTAAEQVALNLSGENFEKVASENKGASIIEQPLKVEKKRKRTLTDERKAKKKKAKRIKRAQKERAQGVRRLKLQPIVKPKVVKYCSFFLKGRCQQGDLCKFSHDTTPLTKSKPCKHFACGNCLKGEDCPFDHELSKYPCHNFSSKGMCIRGDKCKFSHKIPASEGLSLTSEVRKSDTPSTTEKLNSGKQSSIQNIPAVPSVEPRTVASSTRSDQKHSVGSSIKSTKAPTEIPKGIRFLSFGKGKLESCNKQQSNLVLERRGISEVGNEQKAVFRPFIKEDMKDNNFLCKPSVTPSSKSLPREVSEASKILEEFLFCGGS